MRPKDVFVILVIFLISGLCNGYYRSGGNQKETVCGEKSSIFSLSAWNMDAVVCVENDSNTDNAFTNLLCLIGDFTHFIWNKTNSLIQFFSWTEEPEDPKTLLEAVGDWLGVKMFKREKKQYSAIQKFMCNNHDKILYMLVGLVFSMLYYGVCKYGIGLKDDTPEPIAFVENFLTDGENESECCKTCSLLTDKSEH